MSRQPLSASFLVLVVLACVRGVSAGPSAEAERLVASWVALWTSYDLDRVDRLFLQDARVTYFSSEKEGLIRGIENVREHHRGFGFVPGGKTAERELWVEQVESEDFGDTLVVAAVWYFGDRTKPSAENQRGPMTMVYVRDAGEFRIAHLNFGNYENRPE
jgi:ketosteroid isomerase-like protein